MVSNLLFLGKVFSGDYVLRFHDEVGNWEQMSKIKENVLDYMLKGENMSQKSEGIVSDVLRFGWGS